MRLRDLGSALSSKCWPSDLSKGELMGTHPIEIALASGLGLLSLLKTVDSRAGISERLATGTRSVTPGSRTDPLGKGSIGRVWDLLWPISPKATNKDVLADKDM